MQVFETVIDFFVFIISQFSTREIAFACAFGILISGMCLYVGVVLRPHLRFMQAVRAGNVAVRSAKANTTWSGEDKLVAVTKVIDKNYVLGVAWNAYRKGLRPNPKKTGELVNPVDPYGWFAMERLPGRGYEKWATTLAGVSLTVGLLFTFVGLTAALFRVGEAGADTAQLRLAIAEILRISSAKFVTSMAGIMAYIGWILVARAHSSAQSKIVLEFADQVQSLTAPVTPEALLLDQLDQAREQTSRLKTLADDMAVAFDTSLNKMLGQRIDALPATLSETIRPALESSVRPVVDAINGMGSAIGSGNHAALEGLISGLVSGVHDATGREMGLLVDAMREAAGELKTAKSSISAGGAEFGDVLARAAEGMSASSTRMAEAMERRAGDIDARMQRIDETLISSADRLDIMGKTMSTQMTDGLRSAMEGMSAAATAGAAAAREHAQAGGIAFGDILAQAAESMNASSRRMADAMESRAGDIDARMRKIEDALSTGASRFDTMGTAISEQMADGLRKAMESIASAAQSGAAAAREHAQAELTPILSELKNLMGEIRNSAEESRGALIEGGKAAANDLGTALSSAGGVLSDASSRASDLLVQSFENATSRMVSAVEGALSGYRTATEALADRLDVVEQSFGSLDQSVRRNIGQLDEANGALTAAGRTFGTVSDQMQRAAAPVVTTLQTLQAAASATQTTLSLVQETSSAIRASATAATASSQSAVSAFRSYEQRFAGVDASLGQTIAKMRDGVVELGNHVTDVVSKYDQHLARAVGQLRSGVEEISAAVEDIGAKLSEAAD